MTISIQSELDQIQIAISRLPHLTAQPRALQRDLEKVLEAIREALATLADAVNEADKRLDALA
jgi:ABC-type transporter Mla subunit MlaD